jgi:hypothetical protein
MVIDTKQTNSQRSTGRNVDVESFSLTGVIDVSDLPTTRVPELAADTDVYIERRGGRTYLVPAN